MVYRLYLEKDKYNQDPLNLDQILRSKSKIMTLDKYNTACLKKKKITWIIGYNCKRHEGGDGSNWK